MQTHPRGSQLPVLCTILVISNAFGTDADSPDPSPPPELFRSTLLGIEIDFPAHWQRASRGFTDAILPFASVPPHAHYEPFRDWVSVTRFINRHDGASATLIARRSFDGTLENAVADVDRRYASNKECTVVAAYETNFTIASGQKGRKIVRRYVSQIDDDERNVRDITYACYITVSKGQAIGLERRHLTSSYAKGESSADELAKCIRLLEPYRSPDPSPNWVTHYGEGFQFDAPGSWSKQWAYDDAVNASRLSRGLIVLDEPLNSARKDHPRGAAIMTSRFKFDKSATMSSVAQTEQHLVKSYSTRIFADVSTSTYVNGNSRQSRQVEAKLLLGKHRTRIVCNLILEIRGGRAQVLSFYYNEAEAKEMLPVLDHIRRSFIAID